jgi:hypothetical protein
MSFSRALLFLALIPAVAIAEDQAMEEILSKSKQIVNEANEIAGDDANELEGIRPTDEIETEWLRGQQLKQLNDGTSDGETAQQRGWNQIMSEVQENTAVVDQGPPRPKVPEDVMYVYISLSMPKETIRSLFLQALGEKELRTIIFILRGWDHPGPNQLVSRLNALFPDAEALRELPNVQINPNLYRQQAVQLVPTFSTKDEKGRWGTVVGSTSITDAVARIEKGLYDGEVIGATFEIEEPDILELIQKRLAKMDWEKEVERVKEDMLTKPTVGQVLPYATQNESYLVDLTIINNSDLRGAKGEVFAQAGTSVNPFDYLTTQKRYIFFDANSNEQVEQALRWKEQNEYTTMITTVPVRTIEGRKAVIQALGQPVHEINSLLIERFRLRAVPSIAYQEEKMLRVDVVATKEPDLTAQN